jgi:hypothetical protein
MIDVHFDNEINVGMFGCTLYLEFVNLKSPQKLTYKILQIISINKI